MIGIAASAIPLLSIASRIVTTQRGSAIALQKLAMVPQGSFSDTFVVMFAEIRNAESRNLIYCLTEGNQCQSGKVILPTDIDISHMSAHLYR